MDNDILINQARQLYAALLAKEATTSLERPSRLEHLGRLIIGAYCRYQRRLNRCVLCYQNRTDICIREPGKKHTPCTRHRPSLGTTLPKDGYNSNTLVITDDLWS